MSSLVNAASAAVKMASAASVTYLVTLIEERTTTPVTPEQFASMTQEQVSDLIERALLKPALPATPEQLARIVDLADQLGKGELVTKDRGQASRQIRAMEADVAARANAKRAITVERASAADGQLDAILSGSPAPVVTDDIPF